MFLKFEPQKQQGTGTSLSPGWWHMDPPPLPAGSIHSVVLPEMKEMQVNSNHSGQEP